MSHLQIDSLFHCFLEYYHLHTNVINFDQLFDFGRDKGNI